MITTARVGSTGTIRITFILPADLPACPVSVVGDFNDWDPYADPLRPSGDGTRSLSITVPEGRTVCFRYLGANGEWFDDEHADGRDSRGSLIAT